MSIQLDTSILTRLCRPNDPAHTTARNAVAKLQAVGRILEIVPQNLYEFWTVATRPVAGNGLGLTVHEAHAEILRLRALFPLRLDDPAIVDVWESLVVAHVCKGKVSHDARLVGAMQMRGVQEILTFNVADFARFSGIFVIDPATV
jgi:predicted nucleic acid-binding protein